MALKGPVEYLAGDTTRWTLALDCCLCLHLNREGDISQYTWRWAQATNSNMNEDRRYLAPGFWFEPLNKVT